MAERVHGISWNGVDLLVQREIVESMHWIYAISDFFQWLKEFDNVILVAHNGRAFDMRILCHAVESVGMQDLMRHRVLACIDSLQLMKKTFPKLKKHSLSALVEHFLREQFNAHDAAADVDILVKVLCISNVTRRDYDWHMYPLDVHFLTRCTLVR